MKKHFALLLSILFLFAFAVPFGAAKADSQAADREPSSDIVEYANSVLDYLRGFMTPENGYTGEDFSSAERLSKLTLGKGYPYPEYDTTGRLSFDKIDENEYWFFTVVNPTNTVVVGYTVYRYNGEYGYYGICQADGLNEAMRIMNRIADQENVEFSPNIIVTYGMSPVVVQKFNGVNRLITTAPDRIAKEYYSANASYQLPTLSEFALERERMIAERQKNSPGTDGWGYPIELLPNLDAASTVAETAKEGANYAPYIIGASAVVLGATVLFALIASKKRSNRGMV